MKRNSWNFLHFCICYFSRVPSVSYQRHFIVTLIDGREYRRLIIVFYLFQLQASEASTPSLIEMRDNPFLVQYTQKSQKIRRRGDEVWKVVSVIRNGMMNFQGDTSRKPIPRGDHLIGRNVNHQGEGGKREKLTGIRYIIKKNF
jgi:hypothetical protein